MIGTVYSGSTLTFADQATAPSAPTVAQIGTAGSTSYTYAITAMYNSEQSPLSTVTTTTTGNAILNGTNYNKITWTAVPGATNYNVYRIATGSGATPSTTGLLGNSAGSLQFLDEATPPTEMVPPPTSDTSNVFGVQTASGTNVLAANTGVGQVSIDDTLTSLSPPTGLSVSATGSAAGDGLGYRHLLL